MVNFKRRLSALAPGALSGIKNIQWPLTSTTQQIQPIPNLHKAILMPRCRQCAGFLLLPLHRLRIGRLRAGTVHAGTMQAAGGERAKRYARYKVAKKPAGWLLRCGEKVGQWHKDGLGIRNYVAEDRKSTRLNSSHVAISYAVFCLKK